MMRPFNRDTILYGIIGGLSAAQAYVSAGELPKSWNAPIGIGLACLVAIKAKLSNGHTKPNSGIDNGGE